MDAVERHPHELAAGAATALSVGASALAVAIASPSVGTGRHLTWVNGQTCAAIFVAGTLAGLIVGALTARSFRRFGARAWLVVASAATGCALAAWPMPGILAGLDVGDAHFPLTTALWDATSADGPAGVVVFFVVCAIPIVLDGFLMIASALTVGALPFVLMVLGPFAGASLGVLGSGVALRLAAAVETRVGRDRGPA